MKKTNDRNWLGIIATAVVIAVFSMELFRLDTRLKMQEVIRLEEALRNAAVSCYVIEGAYPSDIDYLIEHYGIIIDLNRYHIFYEAYASNVMPDIRIYRKGTP